MQQARQIILDNRFQNGFAVKPQEDGNNDIIGYLDCGAASEKPSMVLAQWYCGYWAGEEHGEFARHNILNGYRKVRDNCYEWWDASKRIKLDRSHSSIELALDASKEYKQDRRGGEPWPHILVEYQTEETPLCSVEAVVLDAVFSLKKFRCCMENADPNLHAAQFVWYAIIKNVNPASKDFGRYFWFGCTLYDHRYEQIPQNVMMDGGKAINTGTLIYQPASTEYLCEMPRLGEKRRVHFNAMWHLRNAYEEACRSNVFSDTQWQDLAITGGNFGWELTGTYDVSMEVEKMELNVLLKKKEEIE